jgi:hypothetical protein
MVPFCINEEKYNSVLTEKKNKPEVWYAILQFYISTILQSYKSAINHQSMEVKNVLFYLCELSLLQNKKDSTVIYIVIR